jgi:hypothetical protein
MTLTGAPLIGLTFVRRRGWFAEALVRLASIPQTGPPRHPRASLPHRGDR